MKRIVFGIAITLASIGGLAVSQNVDEVIVRAHRIPNGKLTVREVSGYHMKEITLSYDVSGAGLDLATDAGAAEFKKRVDEAARGACEETTRLYPDATPDDAACIKAAVKGAMPKVKALIAAAHKAPAQQ